MVILHFLLTGYRVVLFAPSCIPFLFLISVKSPSTSIEPYEQYADQCERVNQALLEFRYTLPQPSPTLSTEYNKPTTERPETPEDQLLNDSIRTDPEGELESRCS